MARTRFDRNLLPDSLRDVIPDGLTDSQMLLYLAAYQSGMESRLEEVGEELEEIRQLLGEIHPVAEPRQPAQQPQFHPPEPARPPEIPDLSTLQTEPSLDGVRVAQAIGCCDAKYVAEVMQWVCHVAKPNKVLEGQAVARKFLEAWGGDEPPDYERILRAKLDALKLLHVQDEIQDLAAE